MASLLTAIGSGIASSIGGDVSHDLGSSGANSLMSSLGLGQPSAAPAATPAAASTSPVDTTPLPPAASLPVTSTMSGYQSPFHALLGQLMGQ